MEKTLIKTKFQYDMEGLDTLLINQFKTFGIKEINGKCEVYDTNMNIILSNGDIINIYFKQLTYATCETKITINGQEVYYAKSNDFFENYLENLYNLYISQAS